MKFVISQNNKKSVWFLTKGMVDALKSVSIEFDSWTNFLNMFICSRQVRLLSSLSYKIL